MAKSIANFSIDHDVKDIFQRKFPRQASAMIESFMRDMINYSADVPDDVSIDDLKKQIALTTETESKTRLKRQALELRLQSLVEDEGENRLRMVTEDMQNWIDTVGAGMVRMHTKDTAQTFRLKDPLERGLKVFREIFLRPDFPRDEYLKLIQKSTGLSVDTLEGEK